MRKFDVYTRRGCHLCEVLIEQLLELLGSEGQLMLHDIDTREDWRLEYDRLVPVVEYRGRRLCQYQLDPDAIRTALTAPE